MNPTKVNFKKVVNWAILSLFVFSFNFGLFAVSPVLAQTKTNAISLSIAKVNQIVNGKIVAVAVTPSPENQNSYSTKTVLTPDDDIRYRWTGFVLDINNVDKPAVKDNGYIKVYTGSTALAENFITNAGQNLPLRSLKDKLIEGENTILLQVVNNEGATITPATELTLKFNFTKESALPSIDIESPKSGALLSDTAIQNFVIKTPKFTLENNPVAKSSPTNGKMAIYWDEVKPEKLIATVYKNEFKSSDYDFSKIEDGEKRKLIFVLKDSKDKEYNPSIQSTLEIKANYRGSIDVGLPKVNIVDPDKSATNLDLNVDSKIVLKVDNFELVDNTADKEAEEGKGVIQVLIDDKKVADNLNKSEFTLSELNIGEMESGQKEMTVELVSKNFEKLTPEVKDTFKFNFVANNLTVASLADPAPEENQNPAWKIIIVVLIVILIIGGIAVLITKA